ncbi:MAG: TolC family protein, partial [SAR86 cluster bacterium]|nr:TolC family protein [SAR86 cluster bacterium]
MTVKNKFFLLALLLFSTSIVSENLNDIYQLALSNDPLLKSAEATYRAGKESKKQGIAGLLPSLNVTGTTNWNEARIEDTLIDEYNSNSYSGVISQPLFRLDKWFKFRQGKALSESAAAEFAYQQQETMIR